MNKSGKGQIKIKDIYSKEELENAIYNTSTSVRLQFTHAPIDVSTDDTIKINIKILFYKNNGEVKDVIMSLRAAELRGILSVALVKTEARS
jgi:hypothetical protein